MAEQTFEILSRRRKAAKAWKLAREWAEKGGDLPAICAAVKAAIAVKYELLLGKFDFLPKIEQIKELLKNGKD